MIDNARQRVLDALMTITAERGLDRVSIREVATTAGVSIGTVQYYCRSKDEMLRMAFEYVAGQIAQRITGIDRNGDVGAFLRRALLEFLPLDDFRRTEARVYLAFAARAAVSPPLAAVQQDLLGKLRALCVQAFQAAGDRGQADPHLDPDLAAAATTAMVDGLLLHLLTDPAGLQAETALAALDAHLGRYLTPVHVSGTEE
ncbi:MAG: TetR/AcrR family transcriptional regulator [Actinoallomurus sp.]